MKQGELTKEIMKCHKQGIRYYPYDSNFKVPYTKFDKETHKEWEKKEIIITNMFKTLSLKQHEKKLILELFIEYMWHARSGDPFYADIIIDRIRKNAFSKRCKK